MKKVFKIVIFISAISFMSGCACRTCKTYDIVIKKHKTVQKPVQKPVTCVGGSSNVYADEVDNF